MKILVVSATPWNDNNSFGNSYSNLFEGIDGLQFANIYCSAGVPDNKLDMVYYQTTQKMLIANLLNPQKPSGRRVYPEKQESASTEQLKGYAKIKRFRLQIFFWMQDLIWALGRWKTPEMERFIDEFQPDIVFQPVYFSRHLSDIALFAQKRCGKPMVTYVSDDCYTLRRLRFSPFYWLDRLSIRRKVKKVVESSRLLYVISRIQKEEYEKIFSVPCKILTKGADFSAPAPSRPINNGEVTLLYAGNIGTGRWKSLALIAEAVERLRTEGVAVRFDIYTSTAMTGKMQRSFCHDGCTVHPPVPYTEIVRLQNEADVMVHAEGLDLKSRLAVHQSFSTKLVDFFSMGKCILAVGTPDEASILHLIENKAAAVAGDRESVYREVRAVATDPAYRAECGRAAYECGRRHHDIREIQRMLKEDLTRESQA